MATMSELGAMAELEAMKEIVKAMEPLTDDQRRRVVAWIADRYGMKDWR